MRKVIRVRKIVIKQTVSQCEKLNEIVMGLIRHNLLEHKSNFQRMKGRKGGNGSSNEKGPKINKLIYREWRALKDSANGGGLKDFAMDVLNAFHFHSGSLPLI
jgi:hypothetical protein